MAYKENVKLFIEKEKNPELYNLEDESDIEKYKELGVVERYFIYSSLKKGAKDSCYKNGRDFAILNLKSEYNKLQDCDGSNGKTDATTLIHTIYSILWGWEKNESNTFGRLAIEQFDCSFGCDTMNSVQTSLNSLIKYEIEKQPSKYREIKKRNLVSNNLCLELYSNPDTQKEFLELLDIDLIDYIKIYHTIGNFILVPAYMNAWRGYNRKIEDYWDKTLLYLQQNGWNSFKADRDSVHNDFVKYINYFFLWEYLDNAGQVVNISSSNSVDQLHSLKYFWQESRKRITKRGIFMAGMLKISLNNRQDYEMIKNKILMSRKIFSSYKDVIDTLIKLKFGNKETNNILRDVSNKIYSIQYNVKR